MKTSPSLSFRTSATLALVLAATLVAAQTRITAPPNKYTPAQDVELGMKAAAEVRQQMPVMRDDEVTSYVEDVGRRLVAAIPAEFRRSEFRYSFDVINVREINAFALPGGPMFVNRGMIEAAKTEGEVAGVMAHELSHVLLRHGTAQASKATKYEIGQVAGAILGSIIGGGWGQVVSQGTQFGLGTAFMRFGREFEKQADLQGAQIMARAGYDPRDMANMFKTIEQQSGRGGPEFLSDHPNPGNRVEYITQGSAVAPRRKSDPRYARLRTGARAPEPPPTRADDRAGDAQRAVRRPPDGHERASFERPERTRAGAVEPLPAIQPGQLDPDQRPVELAAAAGQQLGDVRTRRRVRSVQRTEHLHPRRGTGRRTERGAQSPGRDRRAARIAGTGPTRN